MKRGREDVDTPFEAKTQGFKGLDDQTTEGKPMSPKNHIF